MDCKMKVKGERLKVKGLFTVLVLMALLTGCKENKWIKTQPSVVVTSSGLQYKIIADPTPQDAQPNTTSTIVCDYTLKLINGYIVDSNNGVALSLSSVIPGFAEGCHKIHSNGDIELYIPAYLGYDSSKYDSDEYNDAEGYGTEGTQTYIPPYSTLIYTVHICSVTGN